MDAYLSDYFIYHIINYGLAVVLYTLIGQVVLGLFIGMHSEFFMLRIFRQITGPFIRLLSPITPSFLHPLFVPLYCAFWMFVLRIIFTLSMLSMGWAPTLEKAGVS